MGMGRPRKPDAGVPLSFRIKPANLDWIDERAASLGVDRTVLIKAMLAKAKLAWDAGWRPKLEATTTTTSGDQLHRHTG